MVDSKSLSRFYSLQTSRVAVETPRVAATRTLQGRRSWGQFNNWSGGARPLIVEWDQSGIVRLLQLHVSDLIVADTSRFGNSEKACVWR